MIYLVTSRASARSKLIHARRLHHRRGGKAWKLILTQRTVPARSGSRSICTTIGGTEKVKLFLIETSEIRSKRRVLLDVASGPYWMKNAHLRQMGSSDAFLCPHSLSPASFAFSFGIFLYGQRGFASRALTRYSEIPRCGLSQRDARRNGFPASSFVKFLNRPPGYTTRPVESPIID